MLEGGAHRLVALTEGFRAGFAGGALVAAAGAALAAQAPELNPVEGLWSSRKAVELAAAFNPARRLCRVLRVRRRPWEVQMAQLLVFGVDSPYTAS